MKTSSKGLRVQSETRSGSALKWIIPLIFLAAAGYIYYVYSSTGSLNPNEEQTEPAARPDNLQVAGMGGKSPEPTSTPKPETPAHPLAGIEGLDESVGNELHSLFKDAENTLANITDVDGAKSAVTKLGEMGEKLGSLLDGLKDSEIVAAVAAKIPTDYLPNLKLALDRAKGVEGVGELIQPVVDTWMEKLNGFGK